MTRSKRRWFLIGGSTVVVLLLVAAALVVWNRNYARAGSKNPGTTCPGTVRARHRPPLTAIGVHRALLVGDSIMFQSSCSIAESLADVGITSVRRGFIGSGLLAGPYDWLGNIRPMLATYKPDVVVAIFVGNYLPPLPRASDGTVIPNNSPAFFVAWQHQAERFSAIVRASGARLYWVSPPPIAFGVDQHAQRIFDNERRIAGDHVLQSGGVLADTHGTETMFKETCGRVRTIRTPDIVHLTDDGARLYGQQIAHDLSAQLGILTSAQPC